MQWAIVLVSQLVAAFLVSIAVAPTASEARTITVPYGDRDCWSTGEPGCEATFVGRSGQSHHESDDAAYTDPNPGFAPLVGCFNYGNHVLCDASAGGRPNWQFTISLSFDLAGESIASARLDSFIQVTDGVLVSSQDQTLFSMSSPLNSGGLPFLRSVEIPAVQFAGLEAAESLRLLFFRRNEGFDEVVIGARQRL